MQDGSEFRAALANGKAASLGHRLVRAARLFNEVALAEFRRDPRFSFARPSHLTVMPHLDLDGTRLGELARRMGVSKQAAGQLVDELERRGIVERRPDPDDGRAKRVSFTDLGRDALLSGLGALSRAEAELTQEMDPTAVAALSDALERITSILEDRVGRLDHDAVAGAGETEIR